MVRAILLERTSRPWGGMRCDVGVGQASPTPEGLLQVPEVRDPGQQEEEWQAAVSHCIGWALGPQGF